MGRKAGKLYGTSEIGPRKRRRFSDPLISSQSNKLEAHKSPTMS
jgi:hypothetical protein